MGRGGGGAVKKDKKHKDSDDGGSVKVGKVNPLATAIVFGAVGIIFLILTIVVPVVLVVSPSGHKCVVPDTINFGEQLFCQPKDLDEKWQAEFSSKGKSKLNIYRVKDSEIKDNQMYRVVMYKDYTTSLGGDDDDRGYEDFAVSGFIETRIILTDLSCKGSKCDDVKMFWLTDAGFNEAINDDGKFVEKTAKKFDAMIKEDFEDYDGSDDDHKWNCNQVLICKAGDNEYNHLVFTNVKSKPVTLKYTLKITYTVYNVTGLTPQTCGNDCVFEDMQTGEDIIIDYPTAKTGLEDEDINDSPANEDDVFFDASIHDRNINWSAVIACALIFGLITLFCIAVAAFYGYKFIKKLGKL